MKMRRSIAIVYTHFPHYRRAVFAAMTQNASYDFHFYYDPAGISATIASGQMMVNHHPMSVRQWNGLMWQGGALRLALLGKVDGFVFLGNPFILSTWIAASVARCRGKPVFFWTHGWLKREVGAKALLRRAFYRLADGLMVYGRRAKEIGKSVGFDPATIHVINNSLDYAAQKCARERVLAEQGTEHVDVPEKPFFLTVSRLVKSVELDKAIDAMALLRSEATLVVVGAGPERAALEARAQRLGVDVRFLGAIYDEAELAQLFVEARAVVSPGKVGLLAMHALAYGAPVITHDDFDRQMPEVEALEAGSTGAFYRYGDVADLSRKMTALLEYPAERRLEIRASGIARIEEGYTPEAQVAYISAALDTKMKRSS